MSELIAYIFDYTQYGCITWHQNTDQQAKLNSCSERCHRGTSVAIQAQKGFNLPVFSTQPMRQQLCQGNIQNRGTNDCKLSGRKRLILRVELVSIFDGLKQIELNGSFVLASDVFSDEDEAIASVPRLRLPADLEITEPARHGTPSSSAFDHFFETAKALERHRDGELGPQGVKSIDDGLVEERAVDTDLYLCPRQARAHGTHTVLDEGVGTVGVVDIAGPMMHIEHLVGLGDGAKQGVVAARTFLFLT